MSKRRALCIIGPAFVLASACVAQGDEPAPDGNASPEIGSGACSELLSVSWQSTAGGAAWTGRGTASCNAGAVTIGADVVGHVQLAPGDVVAGGASLLILGSAGTQVIVGEPRVVFDLGCGAGPVGAPSTLSLTAPTLHYQVGGSPAPVPWYPSPNPNHPPANQGVVIVPEVCAPGDLVQFVGVTFTADLRTP